MLKPRIRFTDFFVLGQRATAWECFAKGTWPGLGATPQLAYQAWLLWNKEGLNGNL